MSKPAIVFVPGSYVLVSAYRPILDALSSQGYEVIAVMLPTIGPASRQGRDEPAPPMYEDAEAIAQEVKKLSDQGKDVVLVGHSYAGIPISQSTKGLDKKTRSAQGKPGGVIRLAFMAALVPPKGGSAASLLSRFSDDHKPTVAIDNNGWMSMEDPAKDAATLCQDLPPEQGEALIRAFAKQSARSFADELTYAGYANIPVSYLLTEEDLAGPPDFQREMIATIEEASGSKVDVAGIAASHMMNASAEKETIEWILDVWRKS